MSHTPITTQVPGLHAPALDRLSQVLQASVDARHLPGAVLLVAKGGQVARLQAFGVQDPNATGAAAQATPMATDSLFRIYSMTKPIVSLAALMLAEEGKLMLVDPVCKYLPEFAKQQVAIEQGGQLTLEPARRETTVHDLLRHTAGLTYGFLGNSIVQQMYEAAGLTFGELDMDGFCKKLAGLPLAHQPGSLWQYGHSTDVLGAVVQRATGQPLGDFLKARIFDPLGMHDTGFHVPAAQQHRLAEAFATDPDADTEVKLINVLEAPRLESGGGGLVSSAPDYYRFLQLMRGRGQLEGVRLVSPSTIDWMTADHLCGIPAQGELLPAGHGFGLGFAVRTQQGLAPFPGSPGLYFWSGIAGTSFFIDPAQDLTAMLLTQAPGQRIHYRTLLRHLVFAAIE